MEIRLVSLSPATALYATLSGEKSQMAANGATAGFSATPTQDAL
jgi:hypothetical protein